jgi:hypothetical protein
VKGLVSRFLLLAAILCLGACGGSSPSKPRDFTPLAFDYMTQIRLNVASVDVENRFVPGPGDVGNLSPVQPVMALRQMGNDRLKSFGTSGRAVLVIKDASIVRGRDELTGRMAVELDIYTSDNQRAAFATAEVLQRRAGEITDLRGDLYDLTKAMMDRMNVELEFQARRSLRDWLLPDVPAVEKVNVQQQDLAPPKR